MAHEVVGHKETVAAFLTRQIALCGKSQIDIARAAGYNKPNIITMFKQGRTKVPLAKVGPLATAIGIDPGYLFQLVLQEYAPETWEAIEAVLLPTLLAKHELDLLAAHRKARSSSTNSGS
jgi:transcriptional regulator with XRE-family HTH domain